MINILFVPRVVTGLEEALLEPQDDGTFAIRLPDDTYISPQPTGEIQTRTEVGEWEKGTRVSADLLRFVADGKIHYIAIQVPDWEPAPPTPTPPTPDNPSHVPPGPITGERAKSVVLMCTEEFPQLLDPFPTDEAAVAACQEFLLRVVWHLQLAGFEAARQKNPSGAISDDKLCILLDTEWVAYDIMSMGYANHATRVQWLAIGGANPVADPGLAD